MPRYHEYAMEVWVVCTNGIHIFFVLVGSSELWFGCVYATAGAYIAGNYGQFCATHSITAALHPSPNLHNTTVYALHKLTPVLPIMDLRGVKFQVQLLHTDSHNATFSL